MAPKISEATSTDDAVAYQDHQTPQQFHYKPKHVETILGDTLSEFSVTYWGIGRSFLSQDSTTGRIRSLVGAVLAGKARIDITGSQRTELIEEIKLGYPNVGHPRLAPLDFSEVEVQPVLAAETLQLGENADVVFPRRIDLGTDFSFLVGTGKGLFAVFVGSHQIGQGIPANPAFGINIVGKTEFVGDPWTVKIKADLSQVWSETRRKYGGSVRYGWFRVAKADYHSHIQDLVRSKVIDATFIEGSMDTEKYGRQILEMGKEIFTAINQQAHAGDGYFKFEPIKGPDEKDLPNNKRFGFGWWGWRASVNASYTHNRFTQSIMYENTISYTGRFKREVAIGMTLAVRCTSATQRYFNDLGDQTEACITQQKVDQMMRRMEAERSSTRRAELLDKIFLMYVSGQITEDQWIKGQTYLFQTSFEEDSKFAPKTVSLGARGTLVLGDEVIVVGSPRDMPSLDSDSLEGAADSSIAYQPSTGLTTAGSK